jgi:hypothetical protein
MAEPRQNPTAVSPARIGVLTALMPIPTPNQRFVHEEDASVVKTYRRH